MFQNLSERIRRGEPLPPLVGPALSALTPLQRLGMARRLRATPVRVDAEVVSFGNITAGGSGKTPAVIERACAELAKGRRVAVLTRGYGSGRNGLDVVDTAKPRNDGVWLGDEPELIARRAPGVVIARCGDRVRAARAAVEQCGCDLLLLDDGFQAVYLDRDENIAVVDATAPFGTGRLIPRGTLREPPAALARATHILLTHCDRVEDPGKVSAHLRAHNAAARLRLTRHAPTHLWSPADDRRVPLEWLENRAVVAACAIARPEHFVATLKACGANVTKLFALPDHAHLPEEAFKADVPVVITEKDAMRLQSAPPRCYALGIELRDME
jgi:tetraacyldisaccharide 4'-kinase